MVYESERPEATEALSANDCREKAPVIPGAWGRRFTAKELTALRVHVPNNS